MTPAVEFENVSRHFGSVRAVDNVSLAVEEGRFFAMLGPSGSGKTTCLRLISGFERPSAGHVRIFGQNSETIPPNRRPVNTVFQDYALFPHLTVRENVAYGPRMAGVDRRTREAAAEEMLALVKLSGLRRPQARRAFGRAAAARGAGARAGEQAPGAACLTNRWARWISSCARRCRTS
jgi:putative spermidine/putrescine transport system ATP-binding protein